MRLGACLVGCFLLVGCSMERDELFKVVDRTAFRYLGTTPFGAHETLTLKEIHLDNGLLAGREVVVEGTVAARSAHRTYVVLNDETARMLVVLTDLEYAGPALGSEGVTAVRVLGTIESGKKGMPIVRATALSDRFPSKAVEADEARL